VPPCASTESSAHVAEGLLAQDASYAVSAPVSVWVSRLGLLLARLAEFLSIVTASTAVAIAIAITLLIIPPLLLWCWLPDEGCATGNAVVQRLQGVDEWSTKPEEVDHQLAHLSWHVAVDRFDTLAEAVPFVVGGGKGKQPPLCKHASVAYAFRAVLALYQGDLCPLTRSAAGQVDKREEALFESAHAPHVLAHSMVTPQRTCWLLGAVHSAEEPVSQRAFGQHAVKKPGPPAVQVVAGVVQKTPTCSQLGWLINEFINNQLWQRRCSRPYTVPLVQI
jgi:hypothetical protein